MTVNFPGPYQLRIFYSVTATPGGEMQHQMNFNVDVEGTPVVGSLFSAISVSSRDDTTDTLDQVVEDFLALIDINFNDAVTTFDYCELWKYLGASFDAVWWSTYTPVHTWTNAGSVQKASETIYTFRSAEGGVMKMTALDTIAVPALPYRYTELSGDNQTLVDWMLANATCFFLARDTSYPIAFMGMFSGQSEHVFKARYR